ncbi:MAG TPA: MarR family transcriptional regulator [Solirubrobacteraceae bacterium]|nr:MarR family transcriptional regulator [Solirubrobacteraceae bacterium]
MGLTAAEAAALGEDAATRIRTFRLIIVLALELRTRMDQLLREDDLTTQQAALLTVIDALSEPSIGQAAGALGTTHQNIRQLADALERKGFVRIAADPADGRIRRLATTPQSDATWQRRSDADQRRVLEWFGELTAVEAQDLFRLLLKAQASVRAVATDGNGRSDEQAS